MQECRNAGMQKCKAGCRQAGCGSTIGDRKDPSGTLGRDRGPHERRMDVKTVANDLGGNFLSLENRAGQTGSAMVERRHAVEQMRRLTRARGDRGKRFVVSGGGMAERNPVAAR